MNTTDDLRALSASDLLAVGAYVAAWLIGLRACLGIWQCCGAIGIELVAINNLLHNRIRRQCREYKNRYGEPLEPDGEFVELLRQYSDAPLQNETLATNGVRGLSVLNGERSQPLLGVGHSGNCVSVKSQKFVVNIIEQVPRFFCKVFARLSLGFLSVSLFFGRHGERRSSGPSNSWNTDKTVCLCRNRFICDIFMYFAIIFSFDFSQPSKFAGTHTELFLNTRLMNEN